MTERLNKRELAKAATRQKVIDAARTLWTTPGSYRDRGDGGAGIREIAAHMGMSTGAVFANFDTKDDVWRAAFGCEPPVDGVLTRAAPDLFQALQDLVDVRPEVAENEDPFAAKAWRSAEALLERVKARLQDEQEARERAPAEADDDGTPPLELAA